MEGKINEQKKEWDVNLVYEWQKRHECIRSQFLRFPSFHAQIEWTSNRKKSIEICVQFQKVGKLDNSVIVLVFWTFEMSYMFYIEI